jgi:hypothetical protein
MNTYIPNSRFKQKQNCKIAGYDTMQTALAGDMVLEISPATVNKAATGATWTRTVTITLKNAAGEVHDWYNKTVTSGCSVADTSTAGTASIPNTSLVFVNGIATKVVSGNAAAWLAGETDTLTIANETIMGYTVTGGTSVQTFT